MCELQAQSTDINKMSLSQPKSPLSSVSCLFLGFVFESKLWFSCFWVCCIVWLWGLTRCLKEYKISQTMLAYENRTEPSCAVLTALCHSFNNSACGLLQFHPLPCWPCFIPALLCSFVGSFVYFIKVLSQWSNTRVYIYFYVSGSVPVQRGLMGVDKGADCVWHGIHLIDHQASSGQRQMRMGNLGEGMDE